MAWCQALCFICVCCCLTVIEDNVTGRKKLLFISSLSPPTYWLSNFAFDLITYIGALVLNGCVLFSSGLFIYKNSTSLLIDFVLLTHAFGACLIALIYVLAKALPLTSTGAVIIFFIFLFAGLVPAAFMLSAEYWHFLNAEELLYLGQPYYNDYAEEIGQIALLALPPYGFITALMELQVVARSLSEQDFATELHRVPDVVWYTTLILSAETLLFIITGILGDLYSNRHLTWKKGVEPGEEANDLEQGKPSGAHDHRPPIEAQKLCKVHNYWDVKCDSSNGSLLSFKKRTVIKNVNFCLPYGICVGLFGHRCSGKTTFCQLLAAMKTATSGRVKFHSAEGTGQALDQIGYAPQEVQLDKQLTVKETLTFYGKVRCVQDNICPKVVHDILCAFDLVPVMNCPIAYINDAERERLSLAAAFVGGPSVVILDEPTKNLNFQECRRLYQAIASLLDSETTTLIASKNIDFLRCVCRDINVISNGQIAEFASLTNQEWKYGAAYIMEIKLLRLGQVPRLSKFVKERVPHAEVAIRSTTAVVKVPQLSDDASPILIMQLADSIIRSFPTDRISIFLISLNDILEAS